MQSPDQLVEYARQIAVYRAYPVLENGLQLLNDYEVDGTIQLGLNSKLEHEEQEFAEAIASKDIWYQYHEAADLLYYSACIGYQVIMNGPEPLPYYKYYKQLESIRVAGLNHKHAELAALAKYAWRASAPGNKDEAHEIDLIKQAIA